MRTRAAILLIFLCVTAAAAAASPPPGPTDLTWVKPQPPLPNWKVLVPASRSSVLWYPPALTPSQGDPYSVTAELRDKSGKVLLYLNAGPKTGNERMDNWPAFRLQHLRDSANLSVNEEATAAGLPFHGGTGRCLMDDYVTFHVGNHPSNHYKEVTCFVQGKTTGSVIVVAALESAWPKYEEWLKRAVTAYEVR
jgi:hypothetical protein